MNTEQKPNDHEATIFITGMRWYSALAVFLIHSWGAWLRQMGYIWNEIVDKWKYWVVSFFLISAFTIAMSLDNAMKKKIYSFSSYIMNRFFRIFPLFFAVALFASFKGGANYYLEMFGVENNISNFLIQLSLLNVFFVQHKNNIIGVEWSIAVEFFYYLLFPLFFTIFRKSLIRSLLILLLFYMISLYSLDIIYFTFFWEWFISWVASHESIRLIFLEFLDPRYLQIWNHWGILKYLFTFACGIFAYTLYQNTIFQSLHSKLNKNVLSFIFLFLLSAWTYFVIGTKENIEFVVTWYIFLLVMACYSRGFFVKLFFENPVILYIGNVSYSFYLIHILVLEYLKMPSLLLQFIVGFILTLIISSITYYGIEKPGIRFGRFISAKYLQKRYH